MASICPNPARETVPLNTYTAPARNKKVWGRGEGEGENALGLLFFSPFLRGGGVGGWGWVGRKVRLYLAPSSQYMQYIPLWEDKSAEHDPIPKQFRMQQDLRMLINCAQM